MTDYDSPWKEALDHFLPSFLEFCFPLIFDGVDWSRGYESLDTELQEVSRDAEMGTRLVDKLFRVWKKDGQETWVLIHIEVQSQPDELFTERMYVYNYRLYDRFRRPVVSLAVLGDEKASWRPKEFTYSLWGCKVALEFPIIKLLDYRHDYAALEGMENLFGTIVLAHLQAQSTREDPEARKLWKLRLIKGLINRGLSAEIIRRLFRVIDWLMQLPIELDRSFIQDLHQYEEEKKMPYVTSVERIGIEKGLAEGLEKGREQGLAQGLEQGLARGRERGELLGLRDGLAIALESKFGQEGLPLVAALEKISDLATLRKFKEEFRANATLDELLLRFSS